MKQRILDILKNADDFVSGEDISNKTGISRAAVWKHIKSLKNKGYEIDSVTNRGYRLVSSPDLITAEGITQNLNTEFIGRRLFIYDETDSTNER
ncbi:MAG: HTH domain-containing protein, partial [Clostridia bacterium]|nr:HTH domain-containing protein [Clostridia bacterium]